MFTAIILVLVATTYRVLMGFAPQGSPEWLLNFAPLAAIALCGGFYLPRRMAVIVPLAALLISDIILNVYRYNQGLFYSTQWLAYAGLALIVLLGIALRGRTPSLAWLAGGSLLGSTVFYLVTNTGSWLTDPAYPKTFVGWLQATTTGNPAVTPPAWAFFRNSAVSDLLYTTLFFACMSLTQQQKSETSRARGVLPAGSEGLLPR